MKPHHSLTLAAAAALAFPSHEGETDFSHLSKDARDLIVSMVCGEFDEADPPESTDSVCEEIRQWAEPRDPEA